MPCQPTTSKQEWSCSAENRAPWYLETISNGLSRSSNQAVGVSKSRGLASPLAPGNKGHLIIRLIRRPIPRESLAFQHPSLLGVRLRETKRMGIIIPMGPRSGSWKCVPQTSRMYPREGPSTPTEKRMPKLVTEGGNTRTLGNYHNFQRVDLQPTELRRHQEGSLLGN